MMDIIFNEDLFRTPGINLLSDNINRFGIADLIYFGLRKQGFRIYATF